MVLIDVQVIFILGLSPRQNRSTFVHMAERQHYSHLSNIFMVRGGSKNHELFIAQRDQGIDLRGAAGRNVASKQGDKREKDGDGNERRWISCPDTIKLARQEPRQPNRRGSANGHSNQHKLRSLTQNQLENIPLLRP